MDIKITQRPAVLGLNIKPPATELKETNSQLEIQPGSSSFEIKGGLGQFRFDYTKSRQSIGIYESQSFMKQMANKGQQVALEGIDRRVQDGFTMADIHKNGFVVNDICIEEAWLDEKEIGVSFLPGTEVTYNKGSFSLDFQVQDTQFDASFYQFDISLDWGKVQTYLEESASIDIRWTGNLLDFVVK